MNAKALIVLLVYLAFAVFCYKWWNDKNKTNCAECATSNSVANNAAASLPLSFKWTDTAAIQGDGFANYRNEQIKNLGPTDTLQIKTWYYDGEPNGEQIAMQRANAIRKIYPEIPDNRVKIITEKKSVEERFKTEQFVAQELAVLNNKNSLVKKDGNKITIYFATNAKSDKIPKEIDDYLNTLANDMKANAAMKVVATGYTDNVGDDAKNLSLSQSRAEFAKQLLQQKGVDASRISSLGKGEQDPAATNDTEEGRKLNRRVEFIINNQ